MLCARHFDSDTECIAQQHSRVAGSGRPWADTVTRLDRLAGCPSGTLVARKLAQPLEHAWYCRWPISTKAVRLQSDTCTMRKQYHFRPGVTGLDAWDVDRLISLSAGLPIIEVPLASIHEIDSVYWYDHDYRPTIRSVAEHARLIAEADLSWPILLSHDGWVMDGMHRVAWALLDGDIEHDPRHSLRRRPARHPATSSMAYSPTPASAPPSPL
jgi:hypothetical protein